VPGAPQTPATGTGRGPGDRPCVSRGVIVALFAVGAIGPPPSPRSTIPPPKGMRHRSPGRRLSPQRRFRFGNLCV